MKLIKFLKIILITFYLLPLTFYFSHPTSAQVNPIPTSTVVSDVVELSALETVFKNILAVATSLAGLAVLIMLISGGFKWMTSGGDPKKVESAKNTITYAVLGIVLFVIAWLILRFISVFTVRPDLLQFTIPTK